MVDKTIYMNVNIGKAPLQPPAKPPETPAVPSRKTSVILSALPVVLSVALGTSLIAVTIMYFQGQKRLRDVEEAVHQIRASLQPNTTLDTSKELDSDVWTKLSRGWRFYGGNLYYFSQERKSWDEAERFCVSQDSHLTSVSSLAEQVSAGSS
ncbi:C-type lectin domain family 17, member A-like isoform 3-T3 [Pangshura tecta]